MVGLELVGLISAYNAEFDRCLNDWKQMNGGIEENSRQSDEFPDTMIRILQESSKLASSNLKPDEYWFVSCLTLLRIIAFNNSVIEQNLRELGLSL